MRIITLSLVLGVVFGLIGKIQSLRLNINTRDNRVQRRSYFKLAVSTVDVVTGEEACLLPNIEDITSDSEKATKG